MKLYRMITGPDDSSFCHRISKALSNGWQVSGSASLTFDANTGRIVCGQAITKDIPDHDYSAYLTLSDF